MHDKGQRLKEKELKKKGAEIIPELWHSLSLSSLNSSEQRWDRAMWGKSEGFWGDFIVGRGVIWGLWDSKKDWMP